MLDLKAIKELKALKVIPAPWDYARCVNQNCPRAVSCKRWCAAPPPPGEFAVNICPDENDCTEFDPVKKES